MRHEKERAKVDAALRSSGVVVVMDQGHIRNPQHMVTTMKAVYDAGFVAEVTFRIEEGILREAMQELVVMRDASPTDKPFLWALAA